MVFETFFVPQFGAPELGGRWEWEWTHHLRLEKTSHIITVPNLWDHWHVADLGGGNSNIFWIFTLKIGEDSHFDEYFSKGLKPPTSDDFPSFRINFFVFSPGNLKTTTFYLSPRWRRWRRKKKRWRWLHRCWWNLGSLHQCERRSVHCD